MAQKHVYRYPLARTCFLAIAVCVFGVPAHAATDTPYQTALSELKKEDLPKAAPAKPDTPQAPADDEPADDAQTPPAATDQ
ncbi:MAG: hypothetical protein ACREIP_16585, partial [Alphaproteobacteria bacterium]